MADTTATTSSPEKEKATPPGKEAITGQKPAGEPTTPDEKVAKLEDEVDILTKKLEQSQNLQSQADRKARIEAIERKKLGKELDRIKSGESYIPPEIPEGETATEREVRLEARIGIQNLILENPEYQELLKQDITLREVLKNNPFAIIGEYFDVQDAVEQVKEKLDERVKQTKPQPIKKEGEGEGPEFEPGPVQPKEPEAPAPTPEHQTPDEKVEQSIKNKLKFT